MTVRELKTLLDQHPDDMEVHVTVAYSGLSATIGTVYVRPPYTHVRQQPADAREVLILGSVED